MLFGASISTRGSFAVPLTRESSEPLIPGEMTPPINSLSALMILNVVAVPKSTTIKGLFSPYLTMAETQLTILSAPTSRASSQRIFRPDFRPGSI